jgi:hypothetical protein
MDFKIGLKRIINVFFWIYLLVGIGLFNSFREDGVSILMSVWYILIYIFIGLIIKLVLNYIIDGFFK